MTVAGTGVGYAGLRSCAVAAVTSVPTVPKSTPRPGALDEIRQTPALTFVENAMDLEERRRQVFPQGVERSAVPGNGPIDRSPVQLGLPQSRRDVFARLIELQLQTAEALRSLSHGFSDHLFLARGGVELDEEVSEQEVGGAAESAMATVMARTR